MFPLGYVEVRPLPVTRLKQIIVPEGDLVAARHHLEEKCRQEKHKTQLYIK